MYDEHDAGILQLQRRSDSNHANLHRNIIWVLQLQRHADSDHADLHFHAGLPVLQRHPDSYDTDVRLLAVFDELQRWVLGRHLDDVLIRLSVLQRDPDSNYADMHLDDRHADSVADHDAGDLDRVDSAAAAAPAAAIGNYLDDPDTRGRDAYPRLNASCLDNPDTGAGDPDAAARNCHTNNRDAGDADRLADTKCFCDFDFNALANGYRDRSAYLDFYSCGVRPVCHRPESHRNGVDLGQRHRTTDEPSLWLADVFRLDHRHV